MNQYFAYTRVSTAKQGEHGVSLQEQKSEIERYSRQRGLAISEWFEERVTAAKLGRRTFMEMMKRLRKGEASGVIIHKIDRSARHLRDWVDIGQLIDDGIEVHFTREAIDMQSSSGRLAADVQAVVAANYVRNLREEIIKGFYGRLKQGLYPMAAPLGYLDAGRGKPKTIDPVRGPLIREAFQLYSSQKYSQASLADEMERRGLRTKTGRRVNKNSLAVILSSTFYYGLIQIKKANKSFAGVHRPLITRALFERVQDILHGRAVRVERVHEYLYSRLIQCQGCGRSLIGETQNNTIYYRCHSRICKGTSLREADIDGEFAKLFTGLQLHPQELEDLNLYLSERSSSAAQLDQSKIAEAELRLAAIRERLNRLMDAMLDGHIDQELFDERKKTLLSERLDLEQQLIELRTNPTANFSRLEEFVEMIKNAHQLFFNGDRQQKRQMIRSVVSKRNVSKKSLDFSLTIALSAIASREIDYSGEPVSSTSRKFWETWVDDQIDAEAA